MIRLLLASCALLLTTVIGAVEEKKYDLGPDSKRVDGVPQGKVTEGVWKSAVFAGTIRQYWVYVPAQYDGKTPAAVIQ